MAYAPIGDHGLVGDGRTAALVTRDGTIDWLCWPDFDSPSLFGALLDSRRGGHFSVAAGDVVGRRYLPHTNVLETRFSAATLTDFLAGGRLVRLLEAHGDVEVRIACTPRPGYGSRVPRFGPLDARTVEIGDPVLRLQLAASHPLDVGEGFIAARLRLRPGERAWVQLAEDPVDDPWLLRDETVAFWRAFVARLRPSAPEAERAALLLKALSYAPTGALISAPTTSLPDRRGHLHGDARYSWLHDGAFALWALAQAGAVDEAGALHRFLLDVTRARHPARVHALYGIRGEEVLGERQLVHLQGYRGARPVRHGSATAAELELDVFGELLEALACFGPRFGARRDDLQSGRTFVDWVAHHWRDHDLGLWERSRKGAFVHSRAGSWLALDRGLRLFPDEPEPVRARWRQARDAVLAEVLERGFDRQLGAFVQAYDSRVLDASALRLPLIGFLPAHDPRMISTVAQIERQLMPDGLVHRWLGDDEPEAYASCNFWLVEVLALLGRHEEARAFHHHVLSFANDLGLFAEEIDPRSRTQWGNFPHAGAHLAVLSACQRLEGHGRGADVPTWPEGPRASEPEPAPLR